MVPDYLSEEDKNLNFQKQNRKSTREKYHFFLNGNELCNA